MQWECKIVQSLWKTVWQFLKKLKIELPYDPAIPFLGICPEGLKAGSQREHIPTFIAALLTKAQRWKQPKFPSLDEWINKTWSIHTVEYYSALKMREILTLTSIWMNHEDIVPSEISQFQKDKYCMTPLI